MFSWFYTKSNIMRFFDFTSHHISKSIKLLHLSIKIFNLIYKIICIYNSYIFKIFFLFFFCSCIHIKWFHLLINSLLILIISSHWIKSFSSFFFIKFFSIICMNSFRNSCIMFYFIISNFFYNFLLLLIC